MENKIAFTVNGEHYQMQVLPYYTLLRLLRDVLVLTGTKNGCSAGECGACTVLLNGQPVNSCLVLAPEIDGCEIITVEGLAQDTQLDPIQETMIESGGTQCGFCTSGVLIAARALLNRDANPSEEEIRLALVGNLCRCTGYTRIVDAVREAARREFVSHSTWAGGDI